ncbi:MAG: hypothetical protein IPM83_11410 [Ignavibacteria bacterium]|nr:hypothetical protein [Ignavibacteria bacterium]
MIDPTSVMMIEITAKVKNTLGHETNGFEGQPSDAVDIEGILHEVVPGQEDAVDAADGGNKRNDGVPSWHASRSLRFSRSPFA